MTESSGDDVATPEDRDELIFAQDEVQQELVESGQHNPPWKVLIVDDERGVHDVTLLALRDFRFHQRRLEFLHAYSAADARALLDEHPDTAVILLDVVMEADDAGLALVSHIREQLGNRFVRIILRTGQPGQAPEARVVEQYDINDYKEKTELTAQKLTTSLYAALRSYHDIISLEQNRRGLERVVASTASIIQIRDLDRFLSGLLMQVVSVLGLDQDAFISVVSGFIAGPPCEEDESLLRILVGVGSFEAKQGQCVDQVLEPEDLTLLRRSLQSDHLLHQDGSYVFRFDGCKQGNGVVFVTGCDGIGSSALNLVKLFCSSASVAYENVNLYHEIEDTQREIVFMLGTVAEFRSRETGNHVRRVAEYVGLLAHHWGLEPTEVEQVKLAAPLHDIGKIAIPDQILNKPGRLTPEEFEIMKSHARIGHEMLKGSSRPILKSAAIIARDHQEKWDGSGYPAGASGETIHLYGRLTAVADVFDALGSDRCYKQAWPLEQIIDYFSEQRSRHFDPRITDILLQNLDEFLVIRERYQDDVNPAYTPFSHTE
ncbi:HD domain-containing phosphohydrolase [endosymbiont of Ridgeia piscesae]|jgi:response regulator RpfG family c-di-GMP phosphodiesterase|uniref:Response regulator n=1 Tax=endosymbiont of Ridgeia piscesae TaxID=54398 RepID=A0A0T5YU18_9GAMM|nr:DUF3369 domain-containing protein [endosymbiont of Ridgeia piscesae]KRT54071.1 Response regulator c-di-GMP phosphodiesterase, RpfG family [endosymbiont of Ridgeia piscesae]KRT59129.1 response regulator [endosymbiont of Ridgeia piscesae]